MKRKLLISILIVTSSLSVFSQIDNTKSDTTRTVAQEPNVTSAASISEGQDNDDNSGNTFIPSMLQSSRDIFVNNTSYTFSIAFFRSRGYDNRFNGIYLNGYNMNSLVTGRATFSQWGGLNHVVRYPDTRINMTPASFTFGEIGGVSNYNLRGSAYSKQIRGSYSLSNRTYNNRLMLTYATGMMKNGWSLAASVSSRFGDNISYVQGTSYDGFSYFVALEKKLNQKNAINLTVLGAPTVRDMQGNSVNEAYNLTGTNYYNPNWGWYNGEQRSARTRSTHEPVALLTHFFNSEDNKLSITSTLGFTIGRNNTTSLNWYDAPDPRPDYYRYLPSYYIEDGDTTSLYWDYLDKWKNDESFSQINWDKMYEVNQLAAAQGKRAQYIVENRIMDHIQIGGASHLIRDINDNIRLYAGAELKGYKQHNYNTINDLLGGLYWIDVDKFSEGAFPDSLNTIYNDLNHKNDTLGLGDVINNNYELYLYTEKIWGLLNFTYNKYDFFVGANIGGEEMWRVGLMKNGRFPENSYGKSDVKSFLTYGAKAGFTYKITGRNYISVNAQYSNDAPSILNAFLAPRIRNAYVPSLKTEKIFSSDLSYIMKYPKFQMRLTGYFTQFTDLSRVISFYHDDYATMVNYAMNGINQRHMGVEVGAEWKMTSMFSLIFAGNFGDYRYSNNPNVNINAENGYDILSTGSQDNVETVYWKDYFVAGTPQVATTMGLKFNHNYWWVNVNANYFDRIFCDLNPERRTISSRGTWNLDNPEEAAIYHSIVDQTRLKGQFTLDVSVSKSWKIKSNTIAINISITNLFNNTNLVTSAWEQYRFDYRGYNATKYQNKYYYAFGTTFYAGINYTF
jgi:hypothetical protein